MRRILSGLVFLAAQALAVEELAFCVLEQREHPRGNFVQGLEIIDGVLLVGTGNYGKSRVRRYAFDSMTLINEQALHPRLFGEGVTQMNGRIYQLTWRSRLGVVYRADDLRPLGRFSLLGEGWGITNNGEDLIYSDGTDTLRFLDPRTLEVKRSVSATLDARPQTRLNELEWIHGRIWANVWQTDDIVIINPLSGAVESRIDLTGLLPASARRPDTDVLNGIAYDRENDALWVTGKHWPFLYRICIASSGVEPACADVTEDTTDDAAEGATAPESR